MRTANLSKIGVLLGLAVVVAVSSGCRGGTQQPIEPSGLDQSRAQDTREQTTSTGQPDVDLETLMFERDGGLRTVYFDFDSDVLRDDARATLRRNAERMREIPGVIVQVEGHTCEIGTQDYNLALGERRANSVRQFLIQEGVSGDRIITVSYGEEMPQDPSNLERNRRAEFSRAM